MTDTQAQQLAEAIAAVEYGELVQSLLAQVETGEMTLEEILSRLAGE